MSSVLSSRNHTFTRKRLRPLPRREPSPPRGSWRNSRYFPVGRLLRFGHPSNAFRFPHSEDWHELFISPPSKGSRFRVPLPAEHHRRSEVNRDGGVRRNASLFPSLSLSPTLPAHSISAACFVFIPFSLTPYTAKQASRGSPRCCIPSIQSSFCFSRVSNAPLRLTHLDPPFLLFESSAPLLSPSLPKLAAATKLCHFFLLQVDAQCFYLYGHVQLKGIALDWLSTVTTSRVSIRFSILYMRRLETISEKKLVRIS